MWDKPPHVEILINDQSILIKDITGTEDKPDLIEFEYELEEEKSYNLIIKRSGKTKNQTIINEKGDILKANTWTAPAKNGARGNVLKGNYKIKWTGPLYLK